MKPTHKLLGCLSLAALLTLADKADPVCITNVYISAWGSITVDNTNGTTYVDGYGTNASFLSGVTLVSSCVSNTCIGPRITINPPVGCNYAASICGTLWWRCNNATNGCDPGGTWHSSDIVLPAQSSFVSFCICTAVSCNCCLFLNCFQVSYPCLPEGRY